MKYFTFFLCFVFLSCSDNSDDLNDLNDDSIYKWIVPKNELRGALSPFPLAKDIKYTIASEVVSIPLNQKVVLIVFDNEIRVYPSHFVNTYEVINGTLNKHQYAITYCPITESIVAFDREYNSKTFTLLASGFLYKNNQVLYDEASDTYWSQMALLCIKGIYQNDRFKTLKLIETTWNTAKTYFPTAKVFTDASISTKNSSSKSKNNPPDKDAPIYGIVNFNAKDNSLLAYSFDSFKNEIQLYKKEVDGEELIIIGNEELRFITSYINNEHLEFTPIQNSFPDIMKDSNGNTWDVFGRATSGSRKGEQLESPTAFFASWWAWNSFYKNVVLEQ